MKYYHEPEKVSTVFKKSEFSVFNISIIISKWRIFWIIIEEKATRTSLHVALFD